MKKLAGTLALLGCLLVCLGLIAQENNNAPSEKNNDAGFDAAIRDNAIQMADQGKQTFRFDTFGDEAF